MHKLPDLSTIRYVNQLGTLRPGMPVMVECFATWCSPCQAMIPHLARMASEFRNVYILAVSVQREDVVADAVKQNPLMRQYNVGIDFGAVRTLTRAMGSRMIPFGMVFDNQGMLVHHGDPSTGEFERQLRQVNGTSTRGRAPVPEPRREPVRMAGGTCSGGVCTLPPPQQPTCSEGVCTLPPTQPASTTGCCRARAPPSPYSATVTPSFTGERSIDQLTELPTLGSPFSPSAPQSRTKFTYTPGDYVVGAVVELSFKGFVSTFWPIYRSMVTDLNEANVIAACRQKYGRALGRRPFLQLPPSLDHRVVGLAAYTGDILDAVRVVFRGPGGEISRAKWPCKLGEGDLGTEHVVSGGGSVVGWVMNLEHPGWTGPCYSGIKALCE
ncbi:hypothetical protein KIPB_010708 [Kipferlia bialata]|uniref:Thioredoxin domain-containing protein n=1 Tax=Kipferlia bialata TaxID=797122 RepID=A0A9K3D6X3_9EUKA|nr:hypothetical protein KIPB_010708 [Kipferlia bialata]|eukprot:g10708.t1